MTSHEPAKRRPRRTAPKTSTPTPAPAFDFPSLDDIMRMTNEQVLASFDGLGVEPHKFGWHNEDNQLNVARYAPMGSTGPVDVTALKDAALADYRACLRTELLGAYLAHWATSLDAGQLIAEIERMSEVSFSESERRYAKRSELQFRVQELAWPMLVSASTLYVPPTNPLPGGK